ncbi:TolC family protein [Vibrio nitrifigilis]|nr:TolC family protein [Vibrio nitrifigilis]
MKNTTLNLKKSALSLTVAALVGIGLSGCSLTPESITDQQKLDLLQQDQLAMFAHQEPISHAITLEEAMARAVKYNLQQRLALMKHAYENQLLDTKRYDLLPSIAANAGWKTRDNKAASSSESVSTGTESLEASTSQEKQLANADLSMSWNVLDFGIGYFAAKAQGNNVLAAEEQRRAVVSDIIQKVRKAYWAAATAQQLEPSVTQALKQAQLALAKAKLMEKERLVAPVDALKYQKSLLQMISQLQNLSSELVMAKAQLAALMNLAPGTKYQLAPIKPETTQLPSVGYSLDNLESLAMVNRPEINEEIYKARNAVLETRSQLTHLLPGASLFVGGHYDSNSFLVNQHWADAGVRVSWNLMNVFSYSSIKDAGKAKQSVATLRRQALRMAVLTQVNVAWQQYRQSQLQYAQASELLRLQTSIAKQTQSAFQSDMKSRLEQIQMLTETALITRHRDQQLAQAYTAYGAIYQAAGLDPLPAKIHDRSVDTLSKAIAQQRQGFIKGKLTEQQQQWLAELNPSEADSKVIAEEHVAAKPTLPESEYGSAFEALGSLKTAIIKDYTSQPTQEAK